MQTGLLIFLAGGLGALCRYGITVWIAGMGLIATPWLAFWATFCANFMGSFFIGLTAVLADQQSWSPLIKLTLITGFLGGFTTFSAFSLESVKLLAEQTLLAMSQIVLTVVLCLFAAAAGMSIAKSI